MWRSGRVCEDLWGKINSKVGKIVGWEFVRICEAP